MITTQHKIEMFNLNLDYPIDNLSIENQTNLLINKKMNEINCLIEKNKDKVIVLDYKDDLISLICYRMLKNVQSICNFPLFITGKRNRTKEYIKKEKRIGKIKLNNFLKKNQCIIIQPFNPIYKVADIKVIFKEFTCNTFYPVETFTPEEFKTAQIFYHIGYIKKDPIQLNSNIIEDFNNFCCYKDNNFCKAAAPRINTKIDMVWLTGIIEKDCQILQEVENSENLVFYFYNKDIIYPIKLISEFSQYVQNKANIPNETNINNYIMVDELFEKYITEEQFNWIGNWPDEVKRRII